MSLGHLMRGLSDFSHLISDLSMRPKLKISNLTNLQDARSSAAVGFDFISFSLERGNPRKLPSSSIWSIINWLSGPEILIELNLASLEELTDVQETFVVQHITFPASEWDIRLAQELPRQITLRADQSHSPSQLETWIEEAEAAGIQLKIELSLSQTEEAEAYLALFPHLLLHFPSLDQTQSMAVTATQLPYGFVLREEAEEEMGQLDYERIDDFIEVFEARFS